MHILTIFVPRTPKLILSYLRTNTLLYGIIYYYRTPDAWKLILLYPNNSTPTTCVYCSDYTCVYCSDYTCVYCSDYTCVYCSDYTLVVSLFKIFPVSYTLKYKKITLTTNTLDGSHARWELRSGASWVCELVCPGSSYRRKGLWRHSSRVEG